MRSLLVLSFLVTHLVHGQPPPGYYDPAAGLTGNALRSALRDIIDGHTVLANSDLWVAFGYTDRKPNNKVWDVYSDIPDGTPPYEFNFVTDQCGNYSGEGDCYNREHTFPQSWFDGAPPMDTDLFHLYPTDAWVNQRRANWPYGEVDAPTWTSLNGSKLGPCSIPGCSGTVFEPIDAYKGDLARNYLYMLTRYYGLTGNWPCPMLEDGEFTPWAETMLLAWHEQDPVSDKEVARNNVIYSTFQGNRNPFIDHPEWVRQIWGPTASMTETYPGYPDFVSVGGRLMVTTNGDQGSSDLSVFDSRGGTIVTRSFSGTYVEIPLDVVPGIYLIRLTTGQGRMVHRLIVD